jgi:ATP-dependent protease Clp ATPase subunit
VDRLALATLMHQRGARLQRILLCGRPGSGKTHLARAVAEIAGTLVHVFDASALVETGYHGIGMDDLFEAVSSAARGDREKMERMVLVLDEIDKLRCPPDLTGVSRDKRLGQQYALLTLLGGGVPVAFDEGRDQVATERMLIIAAGAFSDAEWSGVREPTTEDLVRYGLLEELADRLSERVVLRPRSGEELVHLFRESLEASGGITEVCRESGYELQVPDATCLYVARAVAEGRVAAGPRTGNAMLADAAKRLLISALRDAVPEGSVLTLAPDDVHLPARTAPQRSF